MTGPSTIALATSAFARRHDDDATPTIDALAAIGVHATMVEWDDDSVDWSAFDLVVVRSTWDYVARLDEFLAWADRVSTVTALANPADVIRWNTDKHYLQDLADEGVPVVPTVFLDAGSLDAATPDRPDERVVAAVRRAASGDSGFVVKPTVSAGAQDTVRYPAQIGDDDRAIGHASELLRTGRDVLVQPYMVGVDVRGETGLVHLGNTFSHAFRKEALLSADGSPTDPATLATMEPRTPSEDELAVGRSVIDATAARFGGPPLYARIDLLPGPDGSPVLLELELTEPSFYLATDPGAPARVAAAFARAAEAARRR